MKYSYRIAPPAAWRRPSYLLFVAEVAGPGPKSVNRMSDRLLAAWKAFRG